MQQPGDEPQPSTGLATAASRAVVDDLLPLAYEELRRMARRELAGHARAVTLDTSALVHEVYLRLAEHGRLPPDQRAYFFGAVARAMRQVMGDAARRRRRLKRGGGRRAVTLDRVELGVDGLAAELLDLDAALERLAALYPRQAQVVECRFFAGLDVEQTSQALQIAPRTVKRDWALARAWLFRELHPGGPS